MEQGQFLRREVGFKQTLRLLQLPAELIQLRLPGLRQRDAAAAGIQLVRAARHKPMLHHAVHNAVDGGGLYPQVSAQCLLGRLAAPVGQIHNDVGLQGSYIVFGHSRVRPFPKQVSSADNGLSKGLGIIHSDSSFQRFASPTKR